MNTYIALGSGRKVKILIFFHQCHETKKNNLRMTEV